MIQEIVDLSKRMIAVPSFSKDTHACKRVLNLIATYLECSPKKYEKNGTLSYLWGSQNNPLTPRLLLSGHIDVVDIEGNKDLLKPKVENGKLKGRGAGDMKGYVASMVYAYKKYIKSKTNANVGLLLTSDEEMGGFDGVKNVVERGLKPKYVFIPDGEFNFAIVESQKAPHHFIFEAISKTNGGHASRSFELDNPINRIMQFYLDTRKKFSKATINNPWKSTFEMTVVNTNNQSKNKIPDQATAAFSWRWPLEQITFKKGRSQILSIAKKYYLKLLMEEGGGEGCISKRNAPFVKSWKTIIEEEIGRKVNFVNMHGSSDGRHFYNSKKYGSKNILTTSGISGGHHQKNEWVDIQSLFDLSEAIYKYQIQLEN